MIDPADLADSLQMLTSMVGLEPDDEVLSIHIIKNKLIIWYLDDEGIKRMKYEYII